MTLTVRGVSNKHCLLTFFIKSGLLSLMSADMVSCCRKSDMFWGGKMNQSFLYCKFGNFCEGLIFPKLRICEVS